LIEAPLTEPALTPVALATPIIPDPTDFPPNVVQLAGHKVQRRRQRAAARSWGNQIAALGFKCVSQF